MQNEWKNLWNKRHGELDKIEKGDVRKTFLELKRSAGFDVVNELTYEALHEQYVETKRNLNQGRQEGIKSVYEVGCGAGANLFLFESEKIQTGGIDYSEGLLDTAKEVLKTEDLMCGDAVSMNVAPKYDSCFSNSVFSYFTDEEYALQVLAKMYEKADYSIGILDIHDIQKQEDFIKYREAIMPDYHERYKNLPKLFYAREFFEKFAADHDMDIVFRESTMKGYWNNQFVFHCYMYKK